LPAADGRSIRHGARIANEEFQAAADLISSKSLNTVYLYFEEEVLEEKANGIAARLFLAEKRFVEVLAEKGRAWQLFHELESNDQSKRNVGQSYHEKEAELAQALETYNQCILEYRAHLVATCGAIRKDLAKYGSPRIA
jgi:hypothetical protein